MNSYIHNTSICPCQSSINQSISFYWQIYKYTPADTAATEVSTHLSIHPSNQLPIHPPTIPFIHRSTTYQPWMQDWLKDAVEHLYDDLMTLSSSVFPP